METTKHTPTPWPAPEYDNDTGPNDDGFWEWWDIPGVARFDRQEDAEFARQAINTHDRLVEAVGDLLEICCDLTDLEGDEIARIKNAQRILAEGKGGES